jgi:nicotinamide mononucleotide transporter
MLLTELPFLQSVVTQFHQTSLLEWVGTISGFICIYLATKASIWNWPISIISVVAYGFLFFENKLYGDTGLQLYFLFTAFYGWYFWLKKKPSEQDKPITLLSFKQWVFAAAATIVLTLLLSLYLKSYTDTDVPYIDGFCTAMSFVAQLMMTRKILENWILWIIVDICYVPLYFHKNLALTAVLYFVLVILAVIGYLDWKKTYREQLQH